MPQDKLLRILRAYGAIDEQVGQCCIGFNYIVGLLIRFITPVYSQSAEDPDGLLGEEMVFWCLFAIMQSLDWRKFFICNSPDLKKLQD